MLCNAAASSTPKTKDVRSNSQQQPPQVEQGKEAYAHKFVSPLPAILERPRRAGRPDRAHSELLTIPELPRGAHRPDRPPSVLKPIKEYSSDDE